eukprot:CAMPEP_0181357154 /NCGR_PEP_ID=MMETSP1106-20121128/4801_1 /TAXON_ID=81844 /ORGANISM="Mantoniella antarctica, Strain SL-175" /LENGTH=397 /DNA_ID=CAMNT_0023469981 /DNA_START=27 /DNA_END=1220 /DNA_ORIENTATION=-
MSTLGSFSVSRLAAPAAVAWKPSRVTSSSASRCRAHFFTRATPRPASAAVTDVAPPTTYTTAEADDRSFMRGKAILVTGATSGLGAELVSEICKLGLQARPSRVILVARDASKAAVTTSQLQAAGIATATYLADVSKPREVIRACGEILAAEASLNIAVLNAGVWAVDPEITLQEDGYETHYATNYLQMCMFVEMLSPLLSRSTPARFCVTGSFTGFSMSEGELNIDALRDGSSGRYQVNNMNGGYPYSQSKLAQHTWCKEAAPTLPAGVTLNVTCPGAVPDTSMPGWQGFKKQLGPFFGILRVVLGTRSVNTGVQPMVHLCGAAAMDGVTGTFVDWGMNSPRLTKLRPSPIEYYPTQSKKPARTIADAGERKKLYEQTAVVMKEMHAKYGGSKQAE